MSKFSERFRQLKEEKQGMTLKELSAQLDISVPNLSYYMKGREPNYDTLIKIADYFNVTVDWLVGRTDARNPSSSDTLSDVENRLGLQDNDKISNEALKYYLSIQDMMLDVLDNVYIMLLRFYGDKSFDIFFKQFQMYFLAFLYEIRSYVYTSISGEYTKDDVLKFLNNTNIISETSYAIMLKCSYSYAGCVSTHSSVISSEDSKLIKGIISFLHNQFKEKYSDQKIRDLFDKMNSL